MCTSALRLVRLPMSFPVLMVASVALAMIPYRSRPL
jgi:hypothetical protein